MIISHISDIHIHNFQRQQEYKQIFSSLYLSLQKNKPNIIALTGDISHSKTDISPEFVDLCFDFLKNLSSMCEKLIIIPGNHDLNIKNKNRLDSISPIVQEIKSNNIIYLKESCIYSYDNFDFYHFSCIDDKWKEFKNINKNKISIVLYHGTIKGAKLDNNIDVKNSIEDLENSIFNYDYGFFGDIHKRQFVKDKKYQYAGSLVQQNFGEEEDKGYLIWDIKNKNDFDVKFEKIDNKNKFISIKYSELEKYLDVLNEDDYKFAKVRIINDTKEKLNNNTRVELKSLFNYISFVEGIHSDNLLNKDEHVTTQHILNVDFQNSFINMYLKKKYSNINDDILNKIKEVNNYYFKSAFNDDYNINTGNIFKLKKLKWSNILIYGENNEINFDNIQDGTIGLIGKNAVGKSSIPDIILFGLYDKHSRELRKTLFTLNSNKDEGFIYLQFIDQNNNNYEIYKTIKRNRFFDKKINKENQSASIALELKRNGETLNQTTKKDTQSTINEIFGNYDNFVMTSIIPQFQLNKFVETKTNDRVKLLVDFLGINLIQRQYELANEDYKLIKKNYKEEELLNIIQQLSIINTNLENNSIKQQTLEKIIDKRKITIKKLDSFKEKLFKSFDDNIDSELLKVNIKQKKQEYDKLNEDKIKLTISIKEFNNVKKIIFDDDNYNEKKENKYKLTYKIKSINDNIINIKKSIKETEKEKAINIPYSEKCDSCYLYKNYYVAIDNKIQKYNKDIEKEEIELQKLNEQFGALSNELKQLDKTKKDYENYKNNYNLNKLDKKELEVVNGKLNDISKIIKQFDNEKEKIDKNKYIVDFINSVDKTKNYVDNKCKQEYSFIEEIKSYIMRDNIQKQQYIERKLELQKLNEQFIVYNYYVDTIKYDGIQTEILKYFIPKINQYINDILLNVVNFNVNIKLNEQNEVKIYIEDEKGVRYLEGGSGMERTISSLAIKTAITLASNFSRMSVCFIDEVFSVIHNDMIGEIQKLLNYLTSVYSHIIIISHIDAIKDMCDSNIEIEYNEQLKESHLKI